MEGRKSGVWRVYCGGRELWLGEGVFEGVEDDSRWRERSGFLGGLGGGLGGAVIGTYILYVECN